jgi:hypothetical protein
MEMPTDCRVEGSEWMPDNKKTITWRSEAYSDVTDTVPFRKHVVQQTEDTFARLVLRELREWGGSATLWDLREEWLDSGSGGKIYEVSADISDAPERVGASAIGAGSESHAAALVDEADDE